MNSSDKESDSAFKLLDAEILRLNADEKEEYMGVKEVAPELITTETDPLFYLKSCKNDASKAAKRIAFYWKLRKEAFQERAYRPLDFTDKGAMSNIDSELLKCGAYAVLPNGTVYINRWRLSESMYNDRHARLRCHFYVLSLAIAHLRKTGSRAAVTTKSLDMNDSEQNSSEDLLMNLKFIILINDPSATSSKNDYFDFYIPKKLNEFVMNALPVANVTVHLVSLPVDVDEQQSAAMSAYRSLVGKLASFLMVMVGTVLGRCTVHHRGSNIDELLQSLKQHGFSKRNLPVCMGGNWSDEHNQQFLQRQLRSEENRHLSEEEKLHRKRQVNRIHSRQKRARRRIEFEVLQEQHVDLTSQNEKLRAENKKLEAILQACTREVILFEAGQREVQADAVSSLASVFHAPQMDSMALQALLLQQQGHLNDRLLPSSFQDMQRDIFADGALSLDQLSAAGSSIGQTLSNMRSSVDRRSGTFDTITNQSNSPKMNEATHFALLQKLQQSQIDSLPRGLLAASLTLPLQQQNQRHQNNDAQLLEQFLQQSQASSLGTWTQEPLPSPTVDSIDVLRSISPRSALMKNGNHSDQANHSLCGL